MYLRKKKKRKQRRFNSNSIFDLETPKNIVNKKIKDTNLFLKDVKHNLEVPLINSIQNTNSFLMDMKNNYFPFMNSIINQSNNKMGKVLSPSLFLLMLVFSYSVKSQITANLNANKMLTQLDDAVSSMKVKSAAYKDRLPTPERILTGMKGWQDVFNMNVNYQLKKIGVPNRLQKMGFESNLGMIVFIHTDKMYKLKPNYQAINLILSF